MHVCVYPPVCFQGAVGTNITIKVLCSVMLDSSLGEPYDRYAAVARLMQNTFSQSCINTQYKSYIQDMSNTSWSGPGAGGGVCVCVCVCVFIHAGLCVCVCVHTCWFVFVCVCSYMLVCVCVCVCVFIHAGFCVLCFSHWWGCVHVYVMFYSLLLYITGSLGLSFVLFYVFVFSFCLSVMNIPEWEPVFLISTRNVQ